MILEQYIQINLSTRLTRVDKCVKVYSMKVKNSNLIRKGGFLSSPSIDDAGRVKLSSYARIESEEISGQSYVAPFEHLPTTISSFYYPSIKISPKNKSFLGLNISLFINRKKVI